MLKSSSPDVSFHVDAGRKRDYEEVRPRESSRSRQWFPWLVPTIVVANTIMFVITMYVNNCPENSFTCTSRYLGRFSFQSSKENPLLGPSSSTLEKMGGLEVSKVVDQHQGWRLITCIWLHGGLFHILANMLSLLFIGIRLEQEFGFLRIGAIYLISGIGGSLLSGLFLGKSSISVGASGALFGLLGAMLSELITNWTIYASKFGTLVTLILIIAVNLAVGALPHVDNYAHIGGFLSGFLLGFVLLIRPQFKWVSSERSGVAPVKKHKMYQYVLWILSIILLIVGFIVGFILLFRGYSGNDHCSWCKYLSCIPSSRWSCDETSSVKCEISTNVSQTNITCQGSGKTRSYPHADLSEGKINSLCAQLCL